MGRARTTQQVSHPTRGAARAGSVARRIAEADEAVRRIVRGLRVASRQVEGRAGVSAAQLYVLQHLSQAPGISLRGLAERIMTDRTSAAYLLDRLELQGLVTRRRSVADGRRADIVVTAAGLSVLASAPTAPSAQLSDALERMSPRDLASLTTGLTRLAEQMGLSAGPAPILFSDTREGARAPKGLIGKAKVSGRPAPKR